MYSSVRSPQDDSPAGDARVADERRFVADVEKRMAQTGPHRLHRIDGLDSTGTAHAVVDPVGRVVDIGLRPGWWSELGPARVAAGLIEAVASARLKAALFPLLMWSGGDEAMPLMKGDVLLRARGRLADADRLIHHADPRLGEPPVTRVITGPRGLFRLHVRGTHIEGADLTDAPLTADDTDRLVADARDALAELGRSRATLLDHPERPR